MAATFREIRDELNNLSEEELDQTATVQLKHTNEFVSVVEVDRVDDSDVLDNNHVVLVINF